MKKIFRLIVKLLLLAVIIISLSFYLAIAKWKSKDIVSVSIPRGATLKQISRLLYENGAIGAPTLFEIYVRVNGNAKALKSGVYDFPAGSTMSSISYKMERGDVRFYEITIVEGWTIRDIANAMKDEPYLARKTVPDEYEKLAFNKELIGSLGLGDVKSLEGYLFPDTYRVNYPLEPAALIKRQVEKFKEVWRELVPGGKPPDGRSVNDVLTLASVVEKETGVPDERPLIAGVFANRLARGIALQSDPTTIYGLKNFNGNLTKMDLANPHPYNTYVHRGLPPGPICNPGKASIAAALNPLKTDYIYFVSKNDGTHFFSADLSEHLKAVRRYQIMGEGRVKK